MTQQNEYKERAEQIREGVDALLEKLNDPNYKKVNFTRDIASALELGQLEVDLYTDAIDFIGSDLKGFNEYSKKFDEVMKRHGKQ